MGFTILLSCGGLKHGKIFSKKQKITHIYWMDENGKILKELPTGEKLTICVETKNIAKGEIVIVEVKDNDGRLYKGGIEIMTFDVKVEEDGKAYVRDIMLEFEPENDSINVELGPIPIFTPIHTYPIIEDSIAFISLLSEIITFYYNDISDMPDYGQISAYDTLKINGTDDDIYYLIEYNYDDGNFSGAMASYPWRFQVIVNTQGETTGVFSAVHYKMINIFPEQNPFWVILNATAKGNGIHEVYKIEDGIPTQLLECDILTFDEHGDYTVYENGELAIEIYDDNNDGYNDIIFKGNCIWLAKPTLDGGWVDNEYSKENPYKTEPVEYVFLYNHETKTFTAKEDYSIKYGL